MAESRTAWEIPASWEPALAAARRGGLLLLIGEADAGKSTLAAVLVRAAREAGRAAAVVDADIGQASVGPPTCISLAVAKTPPRSLEDLHAEAIEFIGAPSPVGHLLAATVGAKRMVEAARARGAETIVVDTTGLLTGSVARALKAAKVQVLDPDCLIALQREDEAEHVLRAYRSRTRPEVVRLRPSARVKPRSREQRAARRQRLFAEYFREGAPIQLAWGQIPMENTAWTTGRELPGHLRAHAEELLGCEVLHAERDSDLLVIAAGQPAASAVREVKEVYGAGARVVAVSTLQNLLVGLLGDRGETLAVGILEELDFRERRLSVFAPPVEAAQVKALRLGSIQVSRDGAQVGWLEPGELG